MLTFPSFDFTELPAGSSPQAHYTQDRYEADGNEVRQEDQEGKEESFLRPDIEALSDIKNDTTLLDITLLPSSPLLARDPLVKPVFTRSPRRTKMPTCSPFSPVHGMNSVERVESMEKLDEGPWLSFLQALNKN